MPNLLTPLGRAGDRNTVPPPTGNSQNRTKNERTMSRPNALNGIRDGRLRGLARTAAKQDFELGPTKNRHAYLRCPTCSTRITFSKTASGTSPRVYLNILTRLRKHGLAYEGRGGEHTAEPPPTTTTR
ncbi:hypothetical protein OG705_29565 [Streptomyces sp. NBC_00838]|uniref:hypothetical protein n=1 Tax=Streptomyces sp. NBC_00838 TaxID=2903680 RepID=UPI00386A8D2A|nr:hypothetical protein OG705_29565 [Streptomyces sp. NBC_00838]